MVALAVVVASFVAVVVLASQQALVEIEKPGLLRHLLLLLVLLLTPFE